MKSTETAAISHSPVSPMEHRWGVRRECRTRVCISAGDELTGTGRIRDISMSGAFLETSLPLPLFAQVEVRLLRDDGLGHLVEFSATVVRRAHDGAGLEWRETAACSICQVVGCGKACASAADH
jgi:hypothetical protein